MVVCFRMSWCAYARFMGVFWGYYLGMGCFLINGVMVAHEAHRWRTIDFTIALPSCRNSIFGVVFF